MAKSFVVNGATLKCALGAAPSVLTVLPTGRVQIGGKPKANIGDCKPMVNIKPFGTCAKMSPPVPCTPVIAGTWMKGKNNVLVGGMPALMDDCMAVCSCGGGIIKIQKDGQ